MVRQSNDILRKTIKRVKVSITNKAERSTAATRKLLADEAEAVLDLAMRYAPKHSGFLNDRTHWEITKSRSGMNRRYVYTIKPRSGLTQRVLKSGRRVTLAQYVHYMHNGTYSLRRRSQEKANSLGLSMFPVTSGKYVGRLFLTRAARQRSLNLHNKVRQAVNKELRR